MFGREMVSMNQERGRTRQAAAPMNPVVPYLVLTFQTLSAVAPVAEEWPGALKRFSAKAARIEQFHLPGARQPLRESDPELN
jgi:hypothetical protein